MFYTCKNLILFNKKRIKDDNLLETIENRILKRGILIAIEGIDGAGKTSQTKILKEKLASMGFSVISLHEPTDGIWGKKIENLVKNGRHRTSPETELNYFIFDRKEDVEKNITPSLQAKKIVIMDRYYFSSVCYQGARDLDLDYIEKRNEEIAPIPNITFILDVDPETALNRIKKSRPNLPNHFERKEYLERVRQNFLKQFSNRPNVIIVEANDTHSISRVASDIWKIVEPIIKDFEE